jgi:ubiquinone/menaquinone biosynthesis C-methylase UbiE
MYLQNKRGKILDIGCGNGDFLIFMKANGWETFGIDFDENAVMAAKKKGLTIFKGSLEDQNFPKNTFDAITLSHVIEHIYDPENMIKMCYDILKPGGLLVISTPNSASIGHRYFKKYWRGLEPPRHIHIFDLNCLKQVFLKSGFSLFKSFTSNRGAKYIYQASNGKKYSENKKYSLKANLFSYAEFILLKLYKEVGEELVVIGKKEGQSLNANKKLTDR